MLQEVIRINQERETPESKSGVIRSLSCDQTYIPFTFCLLSNDIESRKPRGICHQEMVTLGKIIHSQIGGWKKNINYNYSVPERKS